MEKYNEHIDILENEELEAATSNVNLYIKLMAYYLVQNRLFDAKFLWSRIPQNIKADNIELQKLNELQQSLFSYNLADVINNIDKSEWSEEIKGVMDDLREATMENLFQLIGKAYTSILDKTLAELTNLHADQYEKKCAELGWTSESYNQQLIVHPKKPSRVVLCPVSILSFFAAIIKKTTWTTYRRFQTIPFIW